MSDVQIETLKIKHRMNGVAPGDIYTIFISPGTQATYKHPIYGPLSVEVLGYSEQRSGSVQFGQNHRIVGYTRTKDLPCKIMNTLELNSELEY